MNKMKNNTILYECGKDEAIELFEQTIYYKLYRLLYDDELYKSFKSGQTESYYFYNSTFKTERTMFGIDHLGYIKEHNESYTLYNDYYIQTSYKNNMTEIIIPYKFIVIIDHYIENEQFYWDHEVTDFGVFDSGTVSWCSSDCEIINYTNKEYLFIYDQYGEKVRENDFVYYARNVCRVGKITSNIHTPSFEVKQTPILFTSKDYEITWSVKLFKNNEGMFKIDSNLINNLTNEILSIP